MQYFQNDESLSNKPKDISFWFLAEQYTFKTIDGVFSKSTLDFGSRVLLEYLVKCNLKGKILDLGTGYGPIGILLKTYFPSCDITMSDVNERAVYIAGINVEEYGYDNKVVLSDGFKNISGFFDAVVFNPPIRSGKENIFRLFEECFKHLTCKGCLYTVIKKDQGALSAFKYLETLFDGVSIVKKEKGYWVIKAEKNSE